jgi:glutaredoxin
MEFLSREGVEYEDRDITQNPDWLDELVGAGYMATPVTMIDDQAVVGYDVARLRKLLRA